MLTFDITRRHVLNARSGTSVESISAQALVMIRFFETIRIPPGHHHPQRLGLKRLQEKGRFPVQA